MKRLITACSAIVSLCIAGQLTGQDMEDTISVTSTIFEHHGMVPEENSAYGANTSIDVSWSNLPSGTRSLALICDDPKVVEIGMMESPFVHWVVYNIPGYDNYFFTGISFKKIWKKDCIIWDFI